VAPVVLFASDPFAGTWKINLNKSKEASDHPRLPKSEIIKVEEQENGLNVANDYVSSKGESVHFEYSVKYDGKDYPVKGSPVIDTVVMKRINPNTIDGTEKKDGMVAFTFRSVISKDGKTRTSYLKGVDANGKPVSWTAVFDKQ
jgi:hypothetical protein